MTGRYNNPRDAFSVITTAAASSNVSSRAAERVNPRAKFLSSSPPQPSSQIRTAAPLQATAASALNRQRPQSSQQYAASRGVKRCANGLEKLAGYSFEEDHDIEARPAPVMTGLDPSQSIAISDDEEFGSDLDLNEIEVVEAALPMPRITSSTTVPKAVIYPTVPRQQQMHSTFQDTHDLEMPSSTMFPWSSSNPEHFPPASAQPAKPARSMQNGFQKASDLRSSGVAIPAIDRKPPVIDAPAQRTIPWLQQPTIDTEKKPVTHALQTPLKSKPGDNLWNISASVVKEQQKLHRQEAKLAADKKKDETEASRPSLITTTRRKRVPRVFLSEEQEHVLNLVVKDRASTFFTGSAGTGKSVLLREIIAAFRRTFAKEPDRIAVTASTGLAACNIGGVTLHSFAGIGLGKDDVPELVRKIKRNSKAKQRWMRTKVLVVDEVSMIDAELFDKLEQVARTVRNNGRPFGGIQLVITGDFFQLPPVPDRNKVARFCFDAATWKTTIAHTIGLHHVFRQKDPVFAGMLNEMREGRLSNASIAAFKALDRPVEYEDRIEATALFPTRKEVDNANTARLDQLVGDTVVFEARDGGEVKDKVARDKLLSNCMAPETITLKKGAQVMLIKNIDEELVNGSIGTVSSFMDQTEFDSFRLQDEIKAKLDPFMHMDEKTELSKEEKARRRLKDNISTARKWPMVCFHLPGGHSREMLCEPETWKIELPNGEVQASRLQVPLILSWALSIHKAQGQTLDRVAVDLGNVFEKGQAYVALSRATSMGGLQVKRFDASKVLAHDRVRNFYSNLAKVELKGERPKAKLST